MSNVEEYNGYVNKETWALCLHINNTQSLYDEVKGMLKASSMPMRALEAWFEEIYTSFWEDIHQSRTRTRYDGDLMLMLEEVGSYWRVDWKEAAEAILGE